MEHYTVTDLKKECKNRGVKGYSKMKKNELIKTLEQNGGGLKKYKEKYQKYKEKKRNKKIKKTLGNVYGNDPASIIFEMQEMSREERKIKKQIKKILEKGEKLAKKNKSGIISEKKFTKKNITLNDIANFMEDYDYDITIIKTSNVFKRKFYLTIKKALEDFNKDTKIIKYEPRQSAIEPNKVHHYFYLSNE